ncbi:hypothetical protein CBR_g51815 [Chara braunii]|uniref:Uncharacterized protein n=1 Tax=Chara braunii TaxID=69332 RepID=A0A388M941_CHABU|nr:hypothetical protein CBR_g51815 [Chara braunii]|eukprot:GBG91081.1 hypothetical protein CBR_g51815 [Chara braunii]
MIYRSCRCCLKSSAWILSRDESLTLSSISQPSGKADSAIEENLIEMWKKSEGADDEQGERRNLRKTGLFPFFRKSSRGWELVHPSRP